MVLAAVNLFYVMHSSQLDCTHNRYLPAVSGDVRQCNYNFNRMRVTCKNNGMINHIYDVEAEHIIVLHYYYSIYLINIMQSSTIMIMSGKSFRILSLITMSFYKANS